ncbi:kelch-like protein 18 [Corticium candelabrum]|uniref:kelch-like protein 18 n=1 Tax=Corticium candelabrum TaxID=121492 RepID=UPI002E2F0872|nr:kelch-like protein 18 [Corticium candelabrum]
MARAFDINRYKHSVKLLHLINEFRKNGRLCDVILKVSTMEISTHRVVLATSIPYFRAMFTTNMAEATQDVVTMKDIDPDVLGRIVEFIYTGHLDVTVDNVQDVLAAASLIQLESAQEICCEFLKEHLEPANCLGIRNFAEANGCTQLTEAVDTSGSRRGHWGHVPPV